MLWVLDFSSSLLSLADQSRSMDSFVVVKGVPSFGQEIMIGNGQLGQQPTQDPTVLPDSSMLDRGVVPVPGGKKQQTSGTSKIGARAGSMGLSLFLPVLLL
jgi:hypothetical protein